MFVCVCVCVCACVQGADVHMHGADVLVHYRAISVITDFRRVGCIQTEMVEYNGRIEHGK
jgi:hypothetical protein